MDPRLAAEGTEVFERKETEGKCWSCQGMGVVRGGAAPDLHASPAVLDEDTFEVIVRGGRLTDNSMPAFPDLTNRELESLRHYVRQQADAGLRAGCQTRLRSINLSTDGTSIGRPRDGTLPSRSITLPRGDESLAPLVGNASPSTTHRRE